MTLLRIRNGCRVRNGRRLISRVVLAAGVLPLWGCVTAAGPAPPEVDLEAPGWTVRTGQALWKPRGERPALAGDVIVARHESGDVFVSFTKSPLPIFSARIDGRRWRIDLVDRGRSYAGRGRPPKRFVWLRLPELLGGGAAPESWRMERTGDDEWMLSHTRSHETIRLVLDPAEP